MNVAVELFYPYALNGRLYLTTIVASRIELYAYQNFYYCSSSNCYGEMMSVHSLFYCLLNAFSAAAANMTLTNHSCLSTFLNCPWNCCHPSGISEIEIIFRSVNKDSQETKK